MYLAISLITTVLVILSIIVLVQNNLKHDNGTIFKYYCSCCDSTDRDWDVIKNSTNGTRRKQHRCKYLIDLSKYGYKDPIELSMQQVAKLINVMQHELKRVIKILNSDIDYDLKHKGDHPDVLYALAIMYTLPKKEIHMLVDGNSPDVKYVVRLAYLLKPARDFVMQCIRKSMSVSYEDMDTDTQIKIRTCLNTFVHDKINDMSLLVHDKKVDDWDNVNQALIDSYLAIYPVSFELLQDIVLRSLDSPITLEHISYASSIRQCRDLLHTHLLKVYNSDLTSESECPR